MAQQSTEAAESAQDSPGLTSVLTVRPAEPGDTALLYSSWLHSFRNAVSMPKGDFFAYYHALLERILARPEVSVLCAVPVSAPDTVVGWVCAERAADICVVHYVYVKDLYRRQGVASLLGSALCIGTPTPIVYTFRTEIAKKLAKKFECIEYVSAGEYLA